ncbi:MAG TPA: YgjP-like metallopeptidase domain-containing protein [Sphingomicrobium sp.]|jgi:predicted metal-dependent hydrolase|nr:YgjP-like metallopeptidase domain-containing protein [Sphingomicrobium sp.]
MSSTARSEALHHDPRLPLPVAVRVHPRARRLRLRLDETGELLLLTCPPRSSRRAALDWAAGQRAWVEARLTQAEPAQPFCPGAIIPVEGRDRRLAWIAGGPRLVTLSDDLLSCGGPAGAFARRIETWLRSHARRILSADTAEAARQAGVIIRRVSIGDAGTRWGSCSESGSIRYNWRLILAPPDVRRWVVAHEVAHRVHMNHGPAFKALEARLFDGDVAAARLLLRRIGPRLKRIGRDV